MLPLPHLSLLAPLLAPAAAQVFTGGVATPFVNHMAGGTCGVVFPDGGLFAGMSWGPTRSVLDKVLPKPGEGPSEQTMSGGRFRFEIETTTTTGARYRTTVAADEDPGYSGTAIMLGQSALALAFDGDTLPDAAGVLTPATGIGQPLVDRLRAHGFTFDCVRV